LTSFLACGAWWAEYYHLDVNVRSSVMALFVPWLYEAWGTRPLAFCSQNNTASYIWYARLKHQI